MIMFNELLTWETKNGATLKIKDMGTSHIKNCIGYLESQVMSVIHAMDECIIVDILEDTEDYIYSFNPNTKEYIRTGNLNNMGKKIE